MTTSPQKIECKELHTHKLPMGALAMDVMVGTGDAYAACMDGVYRVSLDTGESERLYVHDSYASGVICLPENGQIVSAGYDGALKWYDLYAKRVVHTVKSHSFWSWDLARARNEPIIASVTGQYLAGSYEYHPKPSAEPCVRVYDGLTRREIAAFDHGPPTQAVALSDDGTHVTAGNLMGEVAVWKIGGQRVGHWQTKDFTAFGIIKSHCQIGGIYAAAFTPDDQVLVAGMGPMRDPMAGNGKMRWQQFDWKDSEAGSAKKVAAANDGQVGEGLMETLAVSPDGNHFVMAGRLRGGTWNVGVFALQRKAETEGDDAAPRIGGELVHSFKIDKRVTSAVFSHDGSRLYLAGSKGQGQDREKKKHFGRVAVYEVV